MAWLASALGSVGGALGGMLGGIGGSTAAGAAGGASGAASAAPAAAAAPAAGGAVAGPVSGATAPMGMGASNMQLGAGMPPQAAPGNVWGSSNMLGNVQSQPIPVAATPTAQPAAGGLFNAMKDLGRESLQGQIKPFKDFKDDPKQATLNMVAANAKKKPEPADQSAGMASGRLSDFMGAIQPGSTSSKRRRLPF